MKLGFKAIARSKDVSHGHDVIVALWVGESDMGKEESIFKDLDDP